MAAYQTVTLSGTYQTPDGTPHKGHVEIIPSERVIKDTTGDVILTGRVKVDLDAQGAFSVVLPATDDPTLNPTGFGYTIAAKLHSSHPPAVSFSLPAALGATTVEDLTPVDPATFAPTTTYAEKSELDAVAATIPSTAADVNALPDTTVIPSTAADVNALPDTTVIPATPSDIGAEPAGLSQATTDALAAEYATQEQARKARWDAAVRGVIVDDFSDLTRWETPSGGTKTQVTTEPGTPYAMRFTANAGGTAQMSRDFVADLTGKTLSFEIKVEDANFSAFRIDLPCDGRSSVRQFASIPLNNTSRAVYNVGRWHRVTIPASMFDKDAGSPTSIADVRLMRLKLTATAGGATSVLIRNMRLHTDAQPAGLLWVFDDSRLNTHDITWPIMQAAGFVGVLPTPTNLVGGTVSGVPVMSLAQLQAMEADGWEVCSHSHNHQTLAGQSLATVQAELRDSYNWLIANGFNKESAKFFVYPGGSWDEQSRVEAARHYRAARTIVDLRQESPYIADPSLLRTTYCDNAKTAASVKAAMDNVKARGGLAILSFHEVIPDVDPSTSTSWPISRFQEVVDHAASLGLPSYRFRDVYPYDFPMTGQP